MLFSDNFDYQNVKKDFGGGGQGGLRLHGGAELLYPGQGFDCAPASLRLYEHLLASVLMIIVMMIVIVMMAVMIVMW